MKTLNTITELEIDRRNWIRGEGSRNSRLFTGEKFCCLGFFCLKVGVSKEEMNDISTPQYLKTKIPQLIETWGVNGDITRLAVDTNDKEMISEKQREESLVEIFQRFEPPVKLSFVN